MKSLFLMLCAVTLLAGCSHGRYDWGGYNSYLYSYYESPQTAEEFRGALEYHIQRLDGMGKAPPPGLYAELGTLYLEAGDTQTAIDYYQKEQDAWPESQHLMTSLITTLSKGAGNKRTGNKAAGSMEKEAPSQHTTSKATGQE